MSGAPHSHSMRWLLLGVIALIGYGSLYPFDFVFDGSYPTLSAALQQLSWARAGKADRVRNVLLYIPLGFCLMWLLRARLGVLWSMLAATFMGAVLSLSIELLQVYLTVRVPSLMDISLNGTGALIGAFCAGVWRQLSALMHLSPNSRNRPGDRAALVLICTWVLWRLSDFEPSLSFVRLKAALRPLLEWDVSWPLTLRYLVMWLVVAQAVISYAQRQRSNEVLLTTIAVVLTGRLLFVTPAFIPSELLALALLLPSLILLHKFRSAPQSALVLCAFTLLFIYDRLSPFHFTAAQREFDFWPFLTWFQQGLPIDLDALLRKLFIFGGMIWLLKDAGLKLEQAIIWIVALVFAIEVVHLWQPERASSLTAPVLALLMGWLMRAASNPNAHRRYRR